MRKLMMSVLFAGATLAGASGEMSAQAPADGNGAKTVIPFFSQNDVNCGSATIKRTIEGWIQIVRDGEGGHFEQIAIFNRTWTFSNAAGETYVINEAGPDRYVMDGDDLILNSTGKSTIHIGILRVNLTTGATVFEAGQDLGLPRVEACARLT